MQVIDDRVISEHRLPDAFNMGQVLASPPRPATPLLSASDHGRGRRPLLHILRRSKALWEADGRRPRRRL